MAALLDRLQKKLSPKSDDELAAEIARLQVEQRRFRQEHRFTRDAAHAAIDARIVEARQLLAGRLQAHVAELPSYPLFSPIADDQLTFGFLASLFTIGTSEEFAAQLHAAVDAAPGYSEFSQAEVDERLAGFDSDVKERQVELARRGLASEQDAVNAKRAALERSA